jgi:hypothetical protein
MATKHSGISEQLRIFRAAYWGATAILDGALSGVEFVLRRVEKSAQDGSLSPLQAAEAAMEARSLLGLDGEGASDSKESE